MKKKAAVLGATGSIGKSSLDVLRDSPEHFQPVLFTAHKNAAALEKIKEEFPQARTVLGRDGLLDAIASSGADITVNGISGAAGLEPSIAVLEAGSALALANKESVVMAGPLILELARKKNLPLIPVDSEHSAIFSLLNAHGAENVHELILTASGGPFRNHSREELAAVTPGQALAHPTWNMGPKISVDSASLANKGLEVIEAARLFGFPPEKIKVVIHPQSIVHSMIRLKNGSVYAQMSKPDMRQPIAAALYWPRIEEPGSGLAAYGSLDFDSLSLSFEKCDMERFPMLELAYQALSGGPFLPSVYNAANEAAVEAFLEGEIAFLEIPRIVGYLIQENRSDEKGELTIEAVLALDKKVREQAAGLIRNGSCKC
ncbi:MAG: 1-deoxy-D-xylulose-5-phosphate reductoisomerase [Treponema sp.]|nr:1-deoxy-D-xylulose-5-phosphate reductoisomerase [Treponema sp.]